MAVRTARVARFRETPPAERAVGIGFGCSGRLHLGHLPNLWLYKTYRDRCDGAFVFLSDVGAYLTRELTWEEVRRSRAAIRETLGEFGIGDDEVVLESERLSRLIGRDTMREHSDNLGELLTLESCASVLDAYDAFLLSVGADEEKYVRRLREESLLPPGLSYVVLEDLPGPGRAEKMSKSAPSTCVHLHECDSADADAHADRLADHLNELADWLDEPSAARDADSTAAIVEAVQRWRPQSSRA